MRSDRRLVRLTLAAGLLLATSAVGTAQTIVRAGSVEPKPAPEVNFTGRVTVQSLTEPAPPVQAGTALVAFAPGARSNWHTHPAGQTLHVTRGCGWTQEQDGAVTRICQGDTVYVKPGVRHWHGATGTTGMTHLAISETLGGRNVVWLEPVTDAQFRGPARAAASSDDRRTTVAAPIDPSPLRRLELADEPTNARKTFGDIAPKLAEITDKVLFGDVWEDDALSPRDRSLVTIVNLAALYRHNEIGFHIRKGLENGLTKDEIVAAITHTAFYAGWPTAMTAIQAAREAFKED